ncbi:MAG: carbonic anhydrase [Alphaproteobacteria bacterium]|nr:MAG: carbonic anhydrase [Alphaproteobacteria bacterium]
MSDAYEDLIEGYRTFRREYLDKRFEAYRAWASKGQNPRTLIIGCSDSRVNPAILTHAGLGEIFVVNNVANIVPPYEKGKSHHKSLGAAIQFAVNHLKVEHIIVLGHSGCGGIRALMTDDAGQRFDAGEDDYIADWVSILQPAKDIVCACCDASTSQDDKLRLAEMEGVLVSIRYLAGYPWVRQAIEAGTLSLHAWYFHVDSGELRSYRPEEGRFKPL